MKEGIMRDEDARPTTLNIPVDQPLPTGAPWRCACCGSRDRVLRPSGSGVELVCTSDRLIGVTIATDEAVGHAGAQCLECGTTCRPPDAAV